MPISAPRPSWPPSLNRVLALTITAELSTSAANRRGAARLPGRGAPPGHPPREPSGGGEAPAHDRRGMARPVAGDVVHRGGDRVDDGDGQDLVEVLGVP